MARGSRRLRAPRGFNCYSSSNGISGRKRRVSTAPMSSRTTKAATPAREPGASAEAYLAPWRVVRVS